jgi:hypothetical protein
MCEVIAMVTQRGEMPRAEAARFLRACYSEITPQDECFVWDGWQSAIAMLGLAELKPVVAQAFEREFISPGWLGFEDFEEDLQQAIDDPAWLLRRSNGEYTPFGDTIEELSTWHCFGPKEAKPERREPAWRHDRTSPVRRSIRSRLSAATIRVHAAAAGNSRNAVWGLTFGRLSSPQVDYLCEKSHK